MFAKIAVLACFIGLVRSGALSNPALNGLGAYAGGYGGYGYGGYGGYGAGYPGLTPGGVATSYANFNKYSGPHVPYNGAYPGAYNGAYPGAYNGAYPGAYNGLAGPYNRAGLAGLGPYAGAGLPYAGADVYNGLRGGYGPAGLPYGNPLGYGGYGAGIGAYGNNVW